jgi:hypothetical protein
MYLSIEVHDSDEKEDAVEEAHEFLIQECCALVKTTKDDPDAYQGDDCKLQVNEPASNFSSIFHLVHNDVVGPEGDERVQVIGRGSEIEAALVSDNFITEPERSSIFIEKLEHSKDEVSKTCNQSTFESKETVCS